MSKPIRVLLIEDNPGDARLVSRMLIVAENPEFDVQHVASLPATLERLNSEQFDVLLLDLGLPGSEGGETVRKAREAAPAVPIVVLTGLDDAQMILEAIKAGAQDYFVKSRINAKNLIDSLVRQTEKKDQR